MRDLAARVSATDCAVRSRGVRDIEHGPDRLTSQSQYGDPVAEEQRLVDVMSDEHDGGGVGASGVDQ